MTIILLLKHANAPIMSIYNLQSFYLPTDMSGNKRRQGFHTRLEITHKYIAVNQHQFFFIEDDYEQSSIQRDNLYVTLKPLLLFMRSVTNCYMCIFNHVTSEVIANTCEFKYYQNITLPASLVSTTTHFYLLNVYSEIVVMFAQSRSKII